MQATRPLLRALVVLMLSGSCLASSTTSTAWRISARTPTFAIEGNADAAASQFAESLRQDVERHPGDFVTFETQTAALRFIDEHGFEAYRETEHRMVDRGVFGYWRGKTVVVIPIAMTSGRRGL